ncbi:MAG: secondary thiamine-phosphate synthase enzyme YjbQ [Planctomycetaceae bacterium]
MSYDAIVQQPGTSAVLVAELLRNSAIRRQSVIIDSRVTTPFIPAQAGMMLRVRTIAGVKKNAGRVDCRVAEQLGYRGRRRRETRVDTVRVAWSGEGDCRTMLSAGRLSELSSLLFLSSSPMPWLQRQISLTPRPRGFHLITAEVLRGLPEIADYQVGLLHLFLQHTSASITLNENADPDVRLDMETSLNAIVPESFPYVHTCEGPDDMPAHVKASLLGNSLLIPIRQGRLALGTWQGITLCEHRNHPTPRSLLLTLQGEYPV